MTKPTAPKPVQTSKPARAESPTKREKRIASEFYRNPWDISAGDWFYADKRGIEFYGVTASGLRISWRTLDALMRRRAIARRLSGEGKL